MLSVSVSDPRAEWVGRARDEDDKELRTAKESDDLATDPTMYLDYIGSWFVGCGLLDDD